METSPLPNSSTVDEARLKYRIVNLHDLPIRITNFAETRNNILEQLPDDEYVLWKSEDEELSQMLIRHLDSLVPKFPYYAVRRINFLDGHYWEAGNPDYSPHVVSNRVRYKGAIHETIVPRKPYGKIDYPIIHDHPLSWKYRGGWKFEGAYLRPVLAVKKAFQVIKG
jgi:hypothetical protein